MEQARHELQRVQALRDLDVLDSLPENEFDGLIQAAAAVCDVPIASLVLVDAERTWFKSQIGLGDAQGAPRHLSFCTHAIDQEGLFQVSDATQDPRFAENPFVTGEMGIRFYAGVPICLSEGHSVGTVCVLDRKPRELDKRQRETLKGLAIAAARALEGRKALRVQSDIAQSLEAALAELACSKEYMRRVYEGTPAMLHSSDVNGRLILVSDSWLAKLGYERRNVIGRRASDFLTKASRDDAVTRVIPHFYRTGSVENAPFQMVTKNGQVIDVLMSAILDRNERGESVSFTTTIDITAQKAVEDRLAQSEARYRGLIEDQSEMISLATTEGKLCFVNHAYARPFGKEPHQMVGRSMFDFIPEAARPQFEADFAHAGQADEPTRNECEIALPDGRTRWIAWRNRILRAADGRAMVHSVGRDIEERVRAERRLRTSEERFRLLSESSPHGVFSSTPNGECTYCNARWREIFWNTAGTVEGEIWFDGVHPDDRPVVAAHWASAAQTGEDIALSFRVRAGQSGLRQIEVRARPWLAPDGLVRSFIGTAQDVTDREQILGALASSEDSLRRLYEATPAMLQSIDTGGCILTVSNAWLSTMGYHRQDVTGRQFTDFMTATSCEHASRTLLPVLIQEGRCDDVACQMRTRTGRIIDVQMSAVLERDVTGRIFRSLVVLNDVTARLKAERALRDSEGRYRMLADATSDVITQLDLNLVRLYVSPACRSVLGYEPEDMLRLTTNATAHPDDQTWVTAAMAEIAAGRVAGDHIVITYRKRHKQGHWIWLEAGINLVRDPDTGTPRHLICVLRDVSERLVAEERDRARAAAERVAESKSQFLSNISHELRTPLTGILGIHDILTRDPDLNPRQRGYVTLAHTAGQSLMAIINDVLDFSKIEAGQLTLESVPFDLATLLEASCDCLRGEATKKSLLLGSRAAMDVKLLGDPVRLRQILVNLIANAVKFTREGRVWVKADYDAEAFRLRLSVSDTGIGIPADQLDTIFERFRQSDGSITRRYGGTGLGLAICRQLVQLMGGTIEVRSVPGVGSTFTVDLPAGVAAAEVSPEPQRGALAVTSRQVLLVEDNPLNQNIIATMLRDQGHHVTVVDNGAQAVEAAAGPDNFDVILMDVQMPVLDGFSATRAIRQHQAIHAQSRTPIIGLTANASEEDLALCHRAGMDGRITKPIDWTALFARMDTLIVERRSDPTAPSPGTALQVLDGDALAKLGRIIGAEQLDAMVRTFMVEIEREGGKLADMDGATIVSRVHGWISLAGHLGFAELGASAADVERDIRSGHGVERVASLQAAIRRATQAARSHSLTRAA